MPIPVTSVPVESPGANGTVQLDNSDQFGEDTFLKLLVAQLKYQNPLQPADPATFLTQSAQFTVVEKLGDLTKLIEGGQFNAQMVTASAFVGRKISFDLDGATENGVVASVRIPAGGDPVLHLEDGRDVPLSAVREVSEPS